MGGRTRIGLIGLGMAVAPHASGLRDLADQIEVVYAFSPSEERRKAFASRFDFPLCDRLETLLDDVSVTAVLVLTPPNTHLDIVRRCAAAGKHVLLEKPIEVTSARSRELVALCRETGVTLGIVLQHRFRPAAVALADAIAGGELGTLVNCSTSIRVWRPQSYYDEPGRGSLERDGGGVLMTQAIHTLDLMLSLAGPVEEVMAYATTTAVHCMQTEDLVCAAARFAAGALGTIEATTTAYPGAAERIEMSFARGGATLAGNSLELRYHDGREVFLDSDGGAGGTGADPMAFADDAHRAVMADFVDAINSGREPRVNGEQGLRVHDLIDALIESGQRGAAVRLTKG